MRSLVRARPPLRRPRSPSTVQRKTPPSEMDEHEPPSIQLQLQAAQRGHSLNRMVHRQLNERDPLEPEAEQASQHLDLSASAQPLPYREALAQLNPPRPRPPAAQVRDTTVRVLPADRARFDELRGFLQPLPAQIRALGTRGSPSDPWLRADNDNLQGVLQVLDQLIADFNTERFLIRFDHPRNADAAASYDFLGNMMHLLPFINPAERTLVAIDLLHEYTHILQDRAREAAFARQRAPQQPSREQELQQEIAARREQVYFSEILDLLGFQRPAQAVGGAQLSDMVLRGFFEQERTATTPREHIAAEQAIRSRIEGPYQHQIGTNTSIKRYAIAIDQHNHAWLCWDMPGRSSPYDLGAIPHTITEAAALRRHLERQIQDLPNLRALFRGAGRQSFQMLTFAVLYDDQQIVEFGVAPP